MSSHTYYIRRYFRTATRAPRAGERMSIERPVALPVHEGTS